MRTPLEITGLTKVFDTPTGPFVAVKDVNAVIGQSEFVCILGHSGCGKSTVLSILAGLAEATYGGVVIDGKEVTAPGPERALVFQSPCLLPWLTARQNVSLAMNTELERIGRGAAGVDSLTLLQNGKRRDLRVEGGVILASGGFTRHAQLRAQMLPGIDADWCPAAPGHTGAAHDLARELGITEPEARERTVARIALAPELPERRCHQPQQRTQDLARTYASRWYGGQGHRHSASRRVRAAADCELRREGRHRLADWQTAAGSF